MSVATMVVYCDGPKNHKHGRYEVAVYERLEGDPIWYQVSGDRVHIPVLADRPVRQRELELKATGVDIDDSGAVTIRPAKADPHRRAQLRFHCPICDFDEKRRAPDMSTE